MFQKPPTIISQFSSNLILIEQIKGIALNTTKDPGVYYIDRINNQSLTGFNIEYFSSAYPVNFTILALSKIGYEIMNEQCRPGTNFSDPFSWVPFSQYVGETELLGLKCQIWNLFLSKQQINLTLLANGSVPVAFLESVFIPLYNETIYITMEFPNLVQSVNSQVFDPPDYCFGHGIVCEGGNVTDMLTYRFHPPGELSLDNRNTGDALGDTAFVCLAGLSGPDQHISLFEVTVNTSWGQYQLCNFNSCVGISVDTVGHEATDGIKFQGGQCDTNLNVGNWFSFNSTFKCQNNSAVGTNNCAWIQQETLKTIDGACLLQNGFFAACKEDGGLPYTHAVAVFENSFKYSNSSQGGCPAISGAVLDWGERGQEMLAKRMEEEKHKQELEAIRLAKDRNSLDDLFMLPFHNQFLTDYINFEINQLNAKAKPVVRN